MLIGLNIFTHSEVGHAATDFEDTPTHANTFRVRPQYRISLRLGSIEDLFPTAPNTEEGRMARLQVLGLFYFPLRHRKRVDAIRRCWPWVKEHVFAIGSDAQADALIQHALRERVIAAAKSPFAKVGKGKLPPGLPAQGNFCKIRVPGGYSYMNSPGVGRNLLDDPAYPFSFGEELQLVEQKYYDDNPVLGRIPLIAKVEKAKGEGEWEPVRDATVYFQLRRPDPLPNPANVIPPHDQINRPDPPAAIKARLAQELGHGVAGQGDAHAKNCHKDRGGKRGLGNPAQGTDVADVIFGVQDIAGFHRAHAGRALERKQFFPKAEKVTPQGNSHRHAVRARTNSEGEAGVIFMPSRMGGDRYKLRAYIGPPTLVGDGEDMGAVRVDTGTMVVWRNVRISRILRKEAPHTVWPDLVAACLNDTQVPLTLVDGPSLLRDVYVMDRNKWVGLSKFDMKKLALRFAHAFCELEPDKGAEGPVPIPENEYLLAYQTAIDDAKQGNAASARKYSIDDLFVPANKPEVARPESLAHLLLNMPDYYDHRLQQQQVGPLVPADPRRLTRVAPNNRVLQADLDQLDDLMNYWALGGFLRTFSKNGSLPGLTIVEGPVNSNWSMARFLGRHSGIALPYRGALVWFGDQAYSSPSPAGTPYGYVENHAHELGHCLYREHAPGHNPGRQDAGGAEPREHDLNNVCVMSYKYSDGFFCAHCLLALSGWNIGGIAP